VGSEVTARKVPLLKRNVTQVIFVPRQYNVSTVPLETTARKGRQTKLYVVLAPSARTVLRVRLCALLATIALRGHPMKLDVPLATSVLVDLRKSSCVALDSIVQREQSWKRHVLLVTTALRHPAPQLRARWEACTQRNLRLIHHVQLVVFAQMQLIPLYVRPVHSALLGHQLRPSALLGFTAPPQAPKKDAEKATFALLGPSLRPHALQATFVHLSLRSTHCVQLVSFVHRQSFNSNVRKVPTVHQVLQPILLALRDTSVPTLPYSGTATLDFTVPLGRSHLFHVSPLIIVQKNRRSTSSVKEGRFAPTQHCSSCVKQGSIVLKVQ